MEEQTQTQEQPQQERHNQYGNTGGDTQYKRRVAYKFRVGDLLAGNTVMNGDRFAHLSLDKKEVVRINLVANIVDKFEGQSANENKYYIFTLDDGSGQIKAKSFGEDVDKLKLASYNQGQTVVVIGQLRSFNNELYVQPEIIKEYPVEYLLIRKLELEKEKNTSTTSSAQPATPQNRNEIKEKLINVIKESENDGGIDLDQIIMKLRDVSPETINNEIRKMLEEGIVFEPRPGRVRWLG